MNCHEQSAHLHTNEYEIWGFFEDIHAVSVSSCVDIINRYFNCNHWTPVDSTCRIDVCCVFVSVAMLSVLNYCDSPVLKCCIHSFESLALTLSTSRWGGRGNFTVTCHSFLVVTVKMVKIRDIYGSYRKIKAGYHSFDHSVHNTNPSNKQLLTVVISWANCGQQASRWT